MAKQLVNHKEMEKQSPGKMRMFLIKSAYKNYSRLAAQLKQRNKRLRKLIETFPKKDRALHNEQLEKIKSKL